jgi:hypothetical protein
MASNVKRATRKSFRHECTYKYEAVTDSILESINQLFRPEAMPEAENRPCEHTVRVAT